MYSYRVEIQFENNMEAKTHQTGNFEIIMVDDKGTLVTAYPTNHGYVFAFFNNFLNKVKLLVRRKLLLKARYINLYIMHPLQQLKLSTKQD